MNVLALECVEINDMGGYFIVNLAFSSNDPNIYCGGNISFTITDASNFTVGKYYGLDLKEVVV
jgi:hypothetical protein